jgi:hypothetical protein
MVFSALCLKHGLLIYVVILMVVEAVKQVVKLTAVLFSVRCVDEQDECGASNPSMHLLPPRLTCGVGILYFCGMSGDMSTAI